MNFIDPDLFPHSSRDVSMAADVQKDLYSTLAFHNGFKYCNSDLQVLKSNIFATFCASLIPIGPLTPEIMQGVSVTFGMRRQKSTYLTEYLSKYWTELHQHFSIGRHMYGGYKTDMYFAVAQGTLLW